jgi:hypothetical protein
MEILSMSNSQLAKKIKGTPFERAGAFGLRRNALYLIEQLHLLIPENIVLKWTKEKTSKLALLSREVLNKFQD